MEISVKFVAKHPTPQSLTDWIAGQFIEGRYLNCRFKYLDSATKRTVKISLLEEQGYICCYTGHPIDYDGSHIEHVKPQSLCEDLETVDYANLLGAFPHSPQGYKGEKGSEYGAQARKNISLVVTPLQSDCESKFRFLASGEIEAHDPFDHGATAAIRVLVLDHPRLQDIRKAVIDEAIFQVLAAVGSKDEILSHLTNLIEVIYERDIDNRLRPFCFVIRGVAIELLENNI